MKSALTAAIQDVNDNPEMSMEDSIFDEIEIQDSIQMSLEHFIELENRFDQAALALESVERALIECRDSNGLSTESAVGLRMSMDSMATGFSMEGFEDISDDLSLEKISGMWNRIKQLYVKAWHDLVDGWASLIKGWSKRIDKHRKITRELRSEWKSKQRDLVNDKHKTSLAGDSLYLAFVVNNDLSRDPLKTIKNDYKYAHYMLETYPKDIQEYLMSLKDVVEKGDYDDNKSFEATVLKKVAAMGHPRDVFKLDIVGQDGHPLMCNRGLDEVKGKSVAAAGSGKDYEKLSQIADGRHVKEYIISLDDLVNGFVFHDIYLSTKDIEDYLDMHEKYIDLVDDLTGNRIFPVDRVAKEILKMTPKIKQSSALSKENMEAVAQINKLLKNFKNYMMRPMRMEVNRVIQVVVSGRTLMSRVIATAETK